MTANYKQVRRIDITGNTTQGDEGSNEIYRMCFNAYVSKATKRPNAYGQEISVLTPTCQAKYVCTISVQLNLLSPIGYTAAAKLPSEPAYHNN